MALAGRAGEAPSTEHGATADSQPAALSFEANVRPVFESFCYDCHGERKRGGLDLRDYANADAIRSHRAVFESVLQQVEGSLMPPANKPQPSASERAALVAWLRDTLFQVDCSRPDPGRVTLRRLNRTEYNLTVRDLTGVDLQPADDFPMDDIGYGFDNIGDVLSLPPVLLEKYLAAAGKVLDAAIVTGPAAAPVKRLHGDDLEGGGEADDGGRTLPSEGEVRALPPLEGPGEFVLKARLYGEQAGPEPVRAAFRVDGKDVQVFEVQARQAAPETYEHRLTLSEGKHRFSVAFLNDYYRPDDPDPANRDRNLHVVHLEIAGPKHTPADAVPESHRRIFFVKPEGSGSEAQLACAREIIGEFARRAYRRPIKSDELERLLGLFRLGQAEGESFEASVKLALQAVMVSPHFLFREELPPADSDPEGVQPVSEFALASRLSYFLWSTMPDEELFHLAERGALRARLDAQIQRMLADPRASTLTANFAGQWLQFRTLEVVAPDRKEFLAFDDELRVAMRRETELFFETILREDRSVLEFLDADWTFLNERLARHYGIEGVRGDAFQRVSLKGTSRGGVLTQGSFLTLTSNPTRTSPVKRGKWVLDNILNTPPPPAPPNVPLLEETPQAKLTGTLRQRMEQHRADPLCASCHALMDPIGFGFENFDGTGAWRDRDGEFPIDPAGQLVSGESFRGPAELKRILLTARREEFLRCLAAKLLTYALGRGLEYYDQCAIDGIVHGMRQGEWRFSALVAGVVYSPPFQLRRGEVAVGGIAEGAVSAAQVRSRAHAPDER